MLKLFTFYIISISVFSANSEVYTLQSSNHLRFNLEKLSQAATKFCQNQMDSSSELKLNFSNSMASWQVFSILDLEPLKSERYKVTFQFFPDKKSRIKKMLVKSLNSNKLFTAESLKDELFYTVGLSALELLIFDTDPIFTKQIRMNPETYCSLIKSIPNFLIHKQLELEKNLNSYFKVSDEKLIIEELFNSLLFSLELILKDKITRPVRYEEKRVFNKRFESYRSSNSLKNIKNNLKSQLMIINETFIPLLLNENSIKAIKEKELILRGYEKTLSLTLEFNEPLHKMNVESIDFERFEELRKMVSALKSILQNQISKTLKIPLQFNGADGD
jgi:predicted lipoprotein